MGWGELQKRRWKELQKASDAHTQSIIFKVAEEKKAHEAKVAGNADMQKKRQQINKESLTFQDHSNEAFIRIQREPDERKMRSKMHKAGFAMLEPEEDVKAGETSP